MDCFDKLNDVVLLFDNYSLNSHDLYTSFQLAGCACPAVVLEDDGFLPDNVISIYSFFLGNYEKNGSSATPKCFNEITVPDFWRISGNDRIGSIHDLNKERGRIFYAEPLYKRRVARVDWYEEKGLSSEQAQIEAFYAMKK